MWFFSLWVRFVTIIISEKKARIMTNNIVADINHILDVIAIINQATSEEKIRKCIPDLLEYLGMCSLASHVCLFELSNGFTKTYEWSQEDADSVPIFAMTANAFVDDIERTKKVGMNEHFSKPLAMEKVIEAIGNYSKKITKI